MQNKKYFTQEQIDKLKFVEKHFKTVIKCQWKSATTVKDNNIVADVYEEATGEKLKRNWSCNNCIFNIYKKVGTLYFESIEKQKEIAYENNKSTDSSSTLAKRRAALAKAREAKAAKEAKCNAEKNNNNENN